MKENRNILKVLTEMLGQQKTMVAELSGIKGQQITMVEELQVMRADLSHLAKDTTELKRLQKRHEDILMHILKALQDDIPKYGQLIEMEKMQGNKIVLRKTG